MRISDWSSDVCSSDLHKGRAPRGRWFREWAFPGFGFLSSLARAFFVVGVSGSSRHRPGSRTGSMTEPDARSRSASLIFSSGYRAISRSKGKSPSDQSSISCGISNWGTELPSMMKEICCHFISASRSEEHTSELQSLMRISYAVFCLKKKTRQRVKTNDKKI